MSKRYQVLARKYRPQAFREVVGQEAAVTTLKNAIRFEKIAHAYLFCGSRGVGKTTLARLFAKALNCQSLSTDFEPCGQCPSCLEVASGQSLDVIEIDGASNRGIDDIRQINETVGYAPSHGKYKIYIIDEVHMLTKEAFNALLKTLEEPPERAKFFFATTEPHKVLPTIISRCQRFDLARIQPTLISDKLQQIAHDLNREVELEALALIAAFSEGSLRDAESLFDQILCFAENTITASIVRQSLGLVPQELFLALDQAFSESRLSYAFELVDQLFQTGKDLPHFLEQLIEHYRNLTLARTLNSSHPSARLYTQQQCLHILDLLIQAEASFQKSTFQRIALESLLLQIIRSKNRIPIEVLVRKVMEHAELEAHSKKEIPPKPEAEAVQPPIKEEAQVLPAPQKVEVPAPVKPQAEAVQPPIKEEAQVLPAPQKVEVPTPIKPQAEAVPAPIKEEAQVLPAPQKVEVPAPLKPQAEAVPTPVKEETAILPPARPKAAESESVPRELKPVPFNPFPAKKEEVVVPKAPEPPAPQPSSFSKRHPSHYDTLMRFAAVELEGTVKN